MEVFQSPHQQEESKGSGWPFDKKNKTDDIPEIEDLGVQVSCGINSSRFQIAGQSIVTAQNMLRPLLNIEPGAIALVNGKEVNPDYLLLANDRLEFVKKSGEKGIN